MDVIKLTPPVPLDEGHHGDTFDCGIPALNDWLKQRALANQHNNVSRVFVSLDEHRNIRGYYALCAGEIRHESLNAKMRRNMPNPIPVVVLGRLAVDIRVQGRQLGRGLLRDAVLRAQQAAQHIGVRALIVHAKNPAAKTFYQHYGFCETPIDPLTLILPLTLPPTAFEALKIE